MTDPQWEDLLRVLDGELLDPLPVGFLVDGPWVAGTITASLADYLVGELKVSGTNGTAAYPVRT